MKTELTVISNTFTPERPESFIFTQWEIILHGTTNESSKIPSLVIHVYDENEAQKFVPGKKVKINFEL